MKHQKVLLLNGSPRKTGTSFRFAETFRELAETAGHTATILHIYDVFDGKIPLENLRQIAGESDIIGLCVPLYVDGLPYADQWFLEEIAAGPTRELNGKRFFAVGQHGYPDVTVCEPLLGACRCFAAVTGMIWLGGLAYGSGAMLNGAPLDRLGRKGRKITDAFKMALDDILQGKVIRSESQKILKKTGELPKVFSRLGAAALNLIMAQTARKLGATDVRRRVYLNNEPKGRWSK